jgi:hypothetical protein
MLVRPKSALARLPNRPLRGELTPFDFCPTPSSSEAGLLLEPPGFNLVRAFLRDMVGVSLGLLLAEAAGW